MMSHILHHIYLHSHHNNLMHKCFVYSFHSFHEFLYHFFINNRINISKISTTKSTFFIISYLLFYCFFYFYCFIWAKIHIYNTPLSYVTELFNLFKLSFLLMPIKIHLKVSPFALILLYLLRNKLSLP